ncbi:hypothetical protein QM012_003878 [Aureobasidium pullulans]|uniref:Uncharacterized protein n=1 Tax=Aureobasidium pullulans TaxID=5580 RepID=A0ABR0T8I7_AURPU
MAPALSSRDVEVLAAAFQCLKTPAEIDFDKLAGKAGYKNGSSARACFQDIKKKLRATGNDIDGDNANKKPTVAKSRKRKQLSSPSDSSSVTLANSSPPLNSDDEEAKAPPKKSKTRATKAKKRVLSTPETEEEEKIHNVKAIAAGRARYAADKLVAQIKKEGVGEICDAEPVGMNIDAGEDERMTAYELVKNEVFGEGVEV